MFGDTLSVYRATELKDSSDDVTTDLAQAVELVVTRYDGRQMVFELYDDPVEPGGPDLDKEARLIQLLDRNGQGTTITYAGSDHDPAAKPQRQRSGPVPPRSPPTFEAKRFV